MHPLRTQYVLAGFLLLLAGAFVAAASGPSSTYEGVADSLQSAVATYLALEPRLTEDQKEEFKEAYGQLCKSYQTSGILLESALDAQDPENAHAAITAYRRTVIRQQRSLFVVVIELPANPFSGHKATARM